MPKLTNISVTTVKTAVYVRRNLTTVKKYITIWVVLFPSPEPLLLHNWNVNALVQQNQLNLSQKNTITIIRKIDWKRRLSAKPLENQKKILIIEDKRMMAQTSIEKQPK